ncbi:MAG: type II toxin-antitoxin system VapC family toxin [Nitrospinae bacterium]|nr:type II toxin-antitoxin system VapC family toxin [Nitrospinota bacterium]
MKKAVFVDTAAWLALINKSDTLHKTAKKIRNSLLNQNAKFIITDYIIVEIANSLNRIPARESAIHLINSIMASRNIEVVVVDKEVFREAWELYSSRTDKEWSMTDCTTFVIMNRRQITEAFTSDRHFEQAGFTILLKE